MKKRAKFQKRNSDNPRKPMWYNCTQFKDRTGLSKNHFEYWRGLFDPTPTRKKFNDSHVLAYLLMYELIVWGGLEAEGLRKLDWKFIFRACNSPGIEDFKFVVDKVDGEIHLMEKDDYFPEKRRQTQLVIVMIEDLIEILAKSNEGDYSEDQEENKIVDLQLYRKKGPLDLDTSINRTEGA